MTATELAQYGYATAGVVVGAFWLSRARSDRDPLGPAPSARVADTGRALLVAVPGWFVLAAVVSLACRAANVSGVGVLLAFGLVHTAVALAVLPLLREALAAPTVRGARAAGLGALSGTTVFALTQGAGLALVAIASACGSPFPEQDVVSVGRGAAGIERAGFAAMTVLCVPFAEETFWRVAVLSYFARHLPPLRALTLSALAFGIAHADVSRPSTWVLAVPFFVVGWLLGWLWLRTRSLPLVACAHAAFNLPTAVVLAIG